MTEYPSKRPGVRLFVRALRPAADWEALYAMREQAGVRPGVLAVPFSDAEAFRVRVTQPDSLSHRLIAEAVVDEGQPFVVGNLGVHLGRLTGADRAGIGIQVDQNYQDMGVGSALLAAAVDLADNWLNLHRLELEVFIDNERAIALYRKFGFQIEATQRREAFRNGAYADTYWMGRLHPGHMSPDAQP